ncbi:transketolase [Moorella thermoacetica]|uniref:Transketolase subunit A n=2 Tax=Neomoorella thermoacetica TaxID=1525 RepID=Q2RLW8_MOOTA|nr:transketolase [Moorella thermoacetica]AKX93067.1 transketolase [Moorella thermoacetica]AKX95618.1 transketolase [Moorella thermoacetica]OIQ53352.1 transketolase [Moorella thermoacetica]OIQ53671.1 transketolase [Moorella thermoacetica]QCZ99427.1 Transketolase [Moorella thermoacetica]
MEKDLQSLMATARRIRRDIVRMVGAAGSGHPGGSLSAVEIMTALYFKVMRLDPERPDWPERDRFVLSKGHAAPVLYAALAERGFFAVDKLDTLRRLGSPLQGHPDRKSLPGVEVSTGSLGHGLAVANGMALAGRLDGRDYHVYVLLGDGELEEGMVWEGAMAAAHYHLDNLTAIVDHNHLQIDGRVEEVMSPEPVADKFRAFGWEVMTIDGHDFGQILDALERAREVKGKPTVIIAETIKGKGVSFMENQAGWHGKAPKPEEVEKALAELA